MKHNITATATLPVSRNRTIIYWITTSLLAAGLFSGGINYLLQTSFAYHGVVEVLGYPAHFLFILGVWKVLGATALLVPGYPRLKEWAYAGAFINMTGAIAANLLTGHGIDHFPAPIVFVLLIMISWATRPASRRLPS